MDVCDTVLVGDVGIFVVMFGLSIVIRRDERDNHILVVGVGLPAAYWVKDSKVYILYFIFGL